MRFKLLSIFLALQVVSFGVWNTFSDEKSITITPVTANEEQGKSVLSLSSAALIESGDELILEGGVDIEEIDSVSQAPSLEAKVVEMPEMPLFSVRNMQEVHHEINPIQENQIKQALMKVPKDHAETVSSITLDYSASAHRGLGGGSLIILRGVNMESEELVGVLIHELAHNVDYGYLDAIQTTQVSDFKDGKETLYESDPSVDFYRLSWESNTAQKAGVSEIDFVSTYAMSDPFEDFAETYTYYRLHNRDFQAMAATSEILQAKYDFMKNTVFNGEVFDMGDGEVDVNERVWDTTVLPYDLNAFMG